MNILNFYDRQVLGALTEPVRKEFHLSDTQVGWLTTAFTLLYAMIGVPLGRLADSWSRKKLLASGVALWSLLTATAAVAANYWMLLVSRLGVGVGEAVCSPAGQSWIGDLFPADKRARPLALFMLGVPIGGALSFLLSGPAAQAFGWRTAMALAALPGLFLAPALLILDEPRRGAADVGRAAGDRAAVWSVLRIPTLWWIIASGALFNFIMYALATFVAALLSRVHGYSVGQAGVASGITYGLGGVMGGLLGGSWGDRVIRRRKDGRMLSVAVTSLVAAPVSYFAFVQPAGSVAIVLVLLTLTYLLFNAYYGFVYSSIQDIVAPALRSTTVAVYFMVMYLGGASFGSLITGNLSDRMARRAATAAGSPLVTEAFKAVGLQQAMLVIPVLAVGLALVLYAGSCTIEADMRRNEA